MRAGYTDGGQATMEHMTRRRIVPKNIAAGPVPEGTELPTEAMEFDVTEEHVGPTYEEWGPWKIVSDVEDRDPTYYPETEERGGTAWFGGAFFLPMRRVIVKALHPRRRHTVTEERKLVRFWTDPEQGRMAEVVRTERRSHRA